VHYDYTVRDCDGAIVQFQYGAYLKPQTPNLQPTTLNHDP